MKKLLTLIALTLLGCGGTQVREPYTEPVTEGGSSDRSATIEGVWYENGQREYQHGIWLKVDFLVSGCYNQRCTVVAHFYDSNRDPLKDLNNRYNTVDGHVATIEDFTPGFEHTRYTKYPLFIPVNEFHVPQGSYKFLFKISVYWRDQGQGFHFVAGSQFYELPFNWNIPETGEITKLDVDYNSKKDDGNGIKITLNYSVHNMVGERGRFVFEFYYELSRLSYLYEHGRPDGKLMSYAIEFQPQYVNTNYTGGNYRVPYSLFPLKIGRNNFFFKVWLQVFRDGKWYTLDATRAGPFWVNNGDLKLPEIWVLDKKKIELDWEPSESEMQTLRETLIEFNKRLYDATDGQIRINAFVIGKMGPNHSHFDPVLRIYHDFKNGNHGQTDEAMKGFIAQVRPFALLGMPDRPGDVHLAFEKMQAEGPELYSRALVHEFCHATFSLTDEYGEMKDPKTGRTFFGSFCAKDEVLRTAWNACIMGTYQPLHRELCSPETHTKDPSNPKLHPLDCYTRVQEALRTIGKELVIPQTPIEGPTDPPEPKFLSE